MRYTSLLQIKRWPNSVPTIVVPFLREDSPRFDRAIIGGVNGSRLEHRTLHPPHSRIPATPAFLAPVFHSHFLAPAKRFDGVHPRGAVNSPFVSSVTRKPEWFVLSYPITCVINHLNVLPGKR